MNYSIRKATLLDTAAIEKLIRESSRVLGLSDYSPEQIEGALQAAWGLDTQLIQDGTYFVVEPLTEKIPIESSQPLVSLVGCGGWSFRETLFGNDAEQDRSENLIDPTQGAAKIRAFFVHPDFSRQGIANLIMDHCEQEARAKGFGRLELMSTLPGERFYLRREFVSGKAIDYPLNEQLSIQFVAMTKDLE